MASSAVQLLETLLQHKKFAGTLVKSRETPRVVSSGFDELDQRIGGGWPMGAISEIVGPRSSGRTRVLLSALMMATRQGQVVALVDALDRFDPRSAADAGLDLTRVLWIRGAPVTVETARPTVIDHAIRQAVRACDLIIRAGGFAVVGLDLCDIPLRRLQALPAVTWLRLAHANDGRDTVGLLGSDAPIGRSARGVSVQIAAQPCWTGASAQGRRLSGFTPAINPRWAGAMKVQRQRAPFNVAPAAVGEGGR
ncbi:MAG: hypothetical protein ABI634_03860 [Acidobacteriota bacterium]